MTAKIQVRRDTANNWSTGSPTLDAGEIGIVIDANEVVGLKIGGNESGTVWSAIPYLAGTLPQLSSNQVDLNHVDFKTTGRFVFTATPTTFSNAPFTTAANDGQANLLVMKFGSNYVQFFCTEGDGSASFPSKFYARTWDNGATSWRSWSALNLWATSASDGVDVNVKNVAVKGDMSAVAADFTGVVTIKDGTAAAPSIVHKSDTDTGIAFPSAGNQIILATNGAAALTVDASGNAVVSQKLTAGNGIVAGGKVESVTNPTSAQDAATKSYLETNRIGQTALIRTLGTVAIDQQVVGATTYSGNNASGFTIVTTGNLTTLKCPAGQTWLGLCSFSRNNAVALDPAWASVTDAGATISGVNNTNVDKPVLLSLIRTA